MSNYYHFFHPTHKSMRHSFNKWSKVRDENSHHTEFHPHQLTFSISCGYCWFSRREKLFQILHLCSQVVYLKGTAKLSFSFLFTSRFCWVNFLAKSYVRNVGTFPHFQAPTPLIKGASSSSSPPFIYKHIIGGA